jgi:hypothetical protein
MFSYLILSVIVIIIIVVVVIIIIIIIITIIIIIIIIIIISGDRQRPADKLSVTGRPVVSVSLIIGARKGSLV